MRYIALSTELKDFKDHFQNSRTFQGSSRIFTKIQGLFKDFKDWHEIQGFQGFFQGCGNPVIHNHPGLAEVTGLHTETVWGVWGGDYTFTVQFLSTNSLDVFFVRNLNNENRKTAIKMWESPYLYSSQNVHLLHYVYLQKQSTITKVSLYWALPHHPMPFVCVFWLCNA